MELLEQFKPEEMAVEELFFSKNITTGIAVAHGRGVILLEAERAGVPAFEYTPMQVKQAVAGYRKAAVFRGIKSQQFKDHPKTDAGDCIS